MKKLFMRRPLPDRRRSWTQHVHIEGQSFYLTVGEYEDGSPGEIFVDVAKQGTFLRGVMGTLARTISIALQCGAELEMIVHSLKDGDFSPCGQVTGSSEVAECDSVTDWIARELEARYLRKPVEKVRVAEGDPTPQERVAGHVSDSWRTGA